MAKMTVEDSSLTAVADAIRTKGGTNDALVFPEGFVSAVGNIQTGGSNEVLAKVVDRSITELTADMLEGCTQIGSNCFRDCRKLTTVSLPEGVTSISTYAFFQCTALTHIEFPNSLTLLGPACILGCTSLEQVTLPSNLQTIDNNAFQECSLLDNVVIPSSVTTIRNSVFIKCTSLKTLTAQRPTPPTLGTGNFTNTALSKIIVPVGSLSKYQSATNWSAYADIMEEAT